MYSIFFKRILDFTFALLLSIVLLPFLLLIALVLSLSTKTSAIFKQARVGKNEKIFYIYKFKTMSDEKDAEGNLLPDEKRITKLGNFLRKTSIDEIPQLVNILKGEMSFIGPRPFVSDTLDYCAKRVRKRYSVLPGITGLAQVNGRNSITFEEKFEYDLKYVDNLTFIGDVKIFIKTIFVILGRKDIALTEESKFKYDKEED